MLGGNLDNGKSDIIILDDDDDDSDTSSNNSDEIIEAETDSDVICLGEISDLVVESKEWTSVEDAAPIFEKLSALDDRMKAIQKIEKSVVEDFKKLHTPIRTSFASRPEVRTERSRSREAEPVNLQVAQASLCRRQLNFKEPERVLDGTSYSFLSCASENSSTNSPNRHLPLNNEKVFVETSAHRAWQRGRVQKKVAESGLQTTYEVKVEGSSVVVVTTSCIAAWKPPHGRPLSPGTRIIAYLEGTSEDARSELYPARIVQSPKPANGERYLIRWDRGGAQYVPSKRIRVLFDNGDCVESLDDGNRLVDVQVGEAVKAKRDGEWHQAKVIQVDLRTAKVKSRDGWSSWLLRTDQFIRRRKRPRCPSTNADDTIDPNTRVSENNADEGRPLPCVRPERTVVGNPTSNDNVEFIPISCALPAPRRQPHARCSPSCASWVPPRHRKTPIVVNEANQIVCWNLLAIPLFHGWRRQVVSGKEYDVRYTTPCGKYLYKMEDIFQYLREVDPPKTADNLSITVDLFDVNSDIRPLARFKGYDKDRIIMTDLSGGKELVPISVYNDIDDSYPETFRYWLTYARKMPVDPKFVLTCDCQDSCRNDRRCSCSANTLQEQKKVDLTKGNRNGENYAYRRLYGRVDTGVFECNTGCGCSESSCLNRVAQNQLITELQLFKTRERGWGVRCLYDIPFGSFIGTISGDLLSDDDAEEEGTAHDDSYLVQLDFLDVAENATRKDKAINPRAPSCEPYVVNAKHKGNVTRFFNHSCDPNMFVQNVFVETYDPRVPLVAFFASEHISAGTELTWDYGYIPSNPRDQIANCLCGTSVCRGTFRLP